MLRSSNKYTIIGQILLSNLILGIVYSAPTDTLIVEDRFRTAIAHYNDERYAVAESILGSLTKEESANHTTAAIMVRMKALYQLGQIEQARKVGRDFFRMYPTSRYVKDIYQTFGDMFIDSGNYFAAFKMYLNARRLGDDSRFINKIDHRLLNTLTLNLQRNGIEEILSLEHKDTNRAILILAQAFSEIYDGKVDACAQTLSNLEVDAVPEVYYDLYEQLLLATYQPGIRSITVGVVLPLSGEHADLGQAFLSGLKRSAKINRTENINISYIVHDNNGENIATVNAVRSLESNPNVLAIMGPLDPTNTLVAATAVMTSNVPLLIPLSTRDEINTLSPNIFQMNSNLLTRGRLAAQYIVNKLGVETVAILAPADDYGQPLVEGFTQEIDKLGISIAAVEWYSGIPENVSRQFGSIRRAAWDIQKEETKYEEYLGMEIDSLNALFEISAEDFFNIPGEDNTERIQDSSEVELETIDGIYIPIRSEDLSYIGTQFPMYNLNTTVLGHESWQNTDILNQDIIGPHINGMTLITNYYFDPLDRVMPDSKVLDKYPGSEMAFYSAYDISQMLFYVLKQVQPERKSIVAAISRLNDYRGLTSHYSFSSVDSNLNVGLQIIQYNNFAFHPVGYFVSDSVVTPVAAAP